MSVSPVGIEEKFIEIILNSDNYDHWFFMNDWEHSQGNFGLNTVHK